MRKYIVMLVIFAITSGTGGVFADASNSRELQGKQVVLNTKSLDPVRIVKTESKKYNIKLDKTSAAILVVPKNKIAVAPCDSNAETEKNKNSQVKLASYNYPTYDGDLWPLIVEAANKYGVDPGLIAAIIQCESGFNPYAQNGSSSASGLGQFINGTWAGTPAGQAGISVFDAKANIEMIAWKISQGGLSAWNASRSCWGG